MALPPLAGATNADEIEASPCVTVDAAGAFGTVAGIRVASEAVDELLFPITLVARTLQVYVLPFDKLDKTIGEVASLLLHAVPPLLESPTPMPTTRTSRPRHSWRERCRYRSCRSSRTTRRSATWQRSCCPRPRRRSMSSWPCSR